MGYFSFQSFSFLLSFPFFILPAFLHTHNFHPINPFISYLSFSLSPFLCYGFFVGVLCFLPFLPRIGHLIRFIEILSVAIEKKRDEEEKSEREKNEISTKTKKTDLSNPCQGIPLKKGNGMDKRVRRSGKCWIPGTQKRQKYICLTAKVSQKGQDSQIYFQPGIISWGQFCWRKYAFILTSLFLGTS